MKGVNTNLYTCMAVCRNFAKGGGGGAKLGYLKRGGRSCKQHQGEHWKTMFKKLVCSF